MWRRSRGWTENRDQEDRELKSVCIRRGENYSSKFMRCRIFCVKIKYGGWASIRGKTNPEIMQGGLRGDSLAMQRYWRNHPLLKSIGCNNILLGTISNK